MPFLKSGMSRRSLIGSLTGALLGALSFAYPGLARVSTDVRSAGTGMPTPAADKDPTFWSGKVAAKTRDSLVVTSMEGTRVVRVEPGQTIWKEFDVSVDAVDIGDSVMAKGEPQPDGSLLARPRWVFVNGGQWDGTITAVRPGGLVVRRRGRDREIALSQRVQVITAVKQLPVAAHIAALTVGREIGMVGLGLPDGSLRATRIWIYR